MQQDLVQIHFWEMLRSRSPVAAAWEKNWDPDVRYLENLALISFTDADTIQHLTKYLNGVELSEEQFNLCKLLSLADVLLIEDLRDDCKRLIERQSLNISNYLEILETCSKFDFEHPSMDKFIRANLTTLSKSPHIVNICLDSVKLLLNDKELSYWSMDDRFRFITNWCNADDGRVSLIEELFEHLDLNMIDNIIMVINDALVQKSRTCLHKVKQHLRERQEKPVPYIFFLPKKPGKSSNIIGFNLEDAQAYKLNFKFSETISLNMHQTMLPGSGRIVSFGKSDWRFYEYDISTNDLQEKEFHCRQHLGLISHIFEANGRLIFILNMSDIGATLYQQVGESSTTLEVEPVLSFPFEVSGACFLDPVIIVSSKLHKHRSTLFLLNLENKSLTKTEFRIEGIYIHPHIQFLFPVGGNIFLGDKYVGVLLTLDVNSNTYLVKSRTSLSDTKYMVISDFIVEISQGSISWCNASNSDICVNNWKSINLEELNVDHSPIALPSYVQRTMPRCHIRCPHCE